MSCTPGISMPNAQWIWSCFFVEVLCMPSVVDMLQIAAWVLLASQMSKSTFGLQAATNIQDLDFVLIDSSRYVISIIDLNTLGLDRCSCVQFCGRVGLFQLWMPFSQHLQLLRRSLICYPVAGFVWYVVLVTQIHVSRVQARAWFTFRWHFFGVHCRHILHCAHIIYVDNMRPGILISFPSVGHASRVS